MRVADVPPTWYLVSPVSVLSWFAYFARTSDDDHLIALTESGTVGVRDAWRQLEAAGTAPRVVVYSSHETLARDRSFADLLEASGFAVQCQSRAAVRVALDKLRMKQFFDRRGFTTAPWWTSDGDCPPGFNRARRGATVVKRRFATQSQGLRLTQDSTQVPSDQEFCEEYRDGVEYSVVVYRDTTGCTTFPPIWKGRTSLELVPPWKRLRVCPHPLLDPALERRLLDETVRMADELSVMGYAEVEYLVTDEGQVLALEINPRVSGTMRLAAMATGVSIFTPDAAATMGRHLPARQAAAEVPYGGPPFADPEAGVFATSRITVSAADFAALRPRLADCAVDPQWLADDAWPVVPAVSGSG